MCGACEHCCGGWLAILLIGLEGLLGPWLENLAYAIQLGAMPAVSAANSYKRTHGGRQPCGGEGIALKSTT
jgi:hypothetical protein